jgi:hypothetical protein
MSLFSSWIHGVAAQPAFLSFRATGTEGVGEVFGQNDTVPTESNPGALYCAKRFRRQSGDVEAFYFCVPTPTVVLGTRANVLRILLMYDFDPGAAIDLITVFDGPNQLLDARVSRVVEGPGFDGVPDPTHDLEEGVNIFPVPGTPLVFWGMCVVVSVKFTRDATIRFTAVGADFEVR